MSQVVACPYCKTRYNLPASALGKRVKCKSCGNAFSATPDAKRTKELRQAKASSGQNVDAGELESMGIGKITAQPDFFPAEAVAGPDPLQNHVVQDPGFSLPGESSAKGGGAKAHGDDAFDSVVSNPHFKSGAGTSKTIKDEAADRRRREEKILEAYSVPSDGVAVKRRKKKAAGNGLTRLSFFLANIGLSLVLGVVFGAIIAIAGIQLQDARQDLGSAPIVFVVLFSVIILIAGICSGLLVRMRYINMAFNSNIWANLACGISIAPTIAAALSVGGGLVFPPLAFIFGLVNLLLSPFSAIVNLGCLILPPDFGQTKKLDVVSYIWLGFFGFALLIGILLAILSVL